MEENIFAVHTWFAPDTTAHWSRFLKHLVSIVDA